METVQKPLIFIETTPTSSALDASLSCIEEYLGARLTRWTAWALPDGPAELTINLGALGAGAKEQQVAPAWVCRTAVYALRLYRSDLLLGPLYRPATGEGPCPVCLDRRWRALRLREMEAADPSSHQQFHIFGQNPWITPFALESLCSLLESVLQHWPARATQYGGQISCLHLDTLTLDTYQLIPDPSCPICSKQVRDTPEALVFSGSLRPKHTISNYRLTQPAEYTLPVKGLLNPVCGMLGATAFPDQRNSIVASSSGKIDLQIGKHTDMMYWSGQGETYRSSQLTGLLEGLERYAGLQPRAKEGQVFACYDALGSDALDPRECGLPRPESYMTNPTRLVPFSTELRIPWVWGYSLRQRRPILVPKQLAYYGNPAVDPPRFVYETSNGCASGSCLEEAILFGLWELLERDGLLITWYARLAPRRIDPWSCSNRHTLHLLDRINRLGYDVYLLDTRFDLRIPSILAMAVQRERKLGTLFVGGGAHFDPEAAIHAAVCEVGKLLPHFTLHVNNALERAQAMARDYSTIVDLHDHCLVYGLPEMAAEASFLYQNPTQSSVATCYGEWLEVRPASPSLRDDLTYCIDLLVGLGMDVIVVDHTSPEHKAVGLTAVKVIVPGLVPITFGWGQERLEHLPRLQTAPKAGGYFETDFDPACYNRTPHPFA